MGPGTSLLSFCSQLRRRSKRRRSTTLKGTFLLCDLSSRSMSPLFLPEVPGPRALEMVVVEPSLCQNKSPGRRGPQEGVRLGHLSEPALPPWVGRTGDERELPSRRPCEWCRRDCCLLWSHSFWLLPWCEVLMAQYSDSALR